MSFSYSAGDFIVDELSWPSPRSLSKFDERIESEFERAMKNGVLRYVQPKGFNEVKCITTAAGMTMVAEFNPNRGFNKRKRATAPTMNQPFDPAAFNFTKIAESEILFKLQPDINLIGSRGHAPIWAIVNVSPINWCHCLYVIEPDGKCPQRLSPEAVRVGFDLMRLSKLPGFRVMFNSMHAWASVNHLHLHSMNLDHELGMDSCPSIPCGDKGLIRQLCNTKTHLGGYVINLPIGSVDIENVVSCVDTIIQFFHRNEIPYNTLWARGTDSGTNKTYANPLYFIDTIFFKFWEQYAFFPAASVSIGHFFSIFLS